MARSDPKATYMDRSIAEYLTAHTTAPDDLLLDLVAETRRIAPERMSMQIDPDQGRLLTLIAQISNAQNAIEIGTFTGYSSICIARGLGPAGRLLCCDVNEEWTMVAKKFWERAGLGDRIELSLGPAADTLRALPDEPLFDMAFIDADKSGYKTYYETILSRLRVGGIILVDNVLWSGRVVDPSAEDPDTQAIRDFNDMVIADDRVTSVMLPVADGLTMIRRGS